MSFLAFHKEDQKIRLSLSGRWTVSALSHIAQLLERHDLARARTLVFDGHKLERFDTAAAWLLQRQSQHWREAGLTVYFEAFQENHRRLLERAAEVERPPTLGRVSLLRAFVEHIGANGLAAMIQARDMISFTGLVASVLAHTILRPRKLRLVALSRHIEDVGLNALPIVGLMSFLIGIVIAYQGVAQLQRFGAEIFVVNLIGVSILRELGVLITAILAAGRSGSAFTAQIGSMKINDEVDAMRTLGLDPMQLLVVPRILALLIALPLLTFFANIVGLAGGAMMSWINLGISPDLFISRVQQTISINHFWVGMIKAPVFALLIGMTGCFQGFRVEKRAESVGARTTQAVVQAIFLVIIADALFSVFFNLVGM